MHSDTMLIRSCLGFAAVYHIPRLEREFLPLQLFIHNKIEHLVIAIV